MPEGLGPSEAPEGIAQGRFHQLQDAQSDLAIALDPESKILAELGVEHRHQFGRSLGSSGFLLTPLPGQTPFPRAALRPRMEQVPGSQPSAGLPGAVSRSWEIGAGGPSP